MSIIPIKYYSYYWALNCFSSRFSGNIFELFGSFRFSFNSTTSLSNRPLWQAMCLFKTFPRTSWFLEPTPYQSSNNKVPTQLNENLQFPFDMFTCNQFDVGDIFRTGNFHMVKLEKKFETLRKIVFSNFVSITLLRHDTLIDRVTWFMDLEIFMDWIG